MNRYLYFDGIRGIMAFNVLICHFVCVYYPEMYFENFANSMGGGLSLFSKTPLSVLVNGNVAVVYFFVLSGFLTAKKAFTTEKSFSMFLTVSINRYLRLLPMVSVTIFVTFVLMKLELLNHINIIDEVKNGAFLLDYCNFDPTIFSMIIDIFISTFISGSKYVGPFWTIKFELWGYIIVFILASCLKWKRWRRLFYPLIVTILYFINVYFVPFGLGMILADIVVFSDCNTTYLSKYYHRFINSRLCLIVLATLGLFFFSVPMYPSGFYLYMTQIPFFSMTAYRCVGVTMLMFVLIKVRGIQKVFENKILLWFGKLSFATYCFHFTIMLSLEAYSFDILLKLMSYDIASVLSFLITIPVIYFSAYIAWKTIERRKMFQIKSIKQAKPLGDDLEQKNKNPVILREKK